MQIEETIKCPHCGKEIYKKAEGECKYYLYLRAYEGQRVVVDNQLYKEDVYYTEDMAINELKNDANWLANYYDMIHCTIYRGDGKQKIRRLGGVLCRSI